MIKHSDGFTLIELMISMTILAVILLLIATTSISIGRIYYKGVTSSRTQEAARSLSAQLSRTIQTTQPTNDALGNIGAFCVGSTRYTYATVDAGLPASHLYADSSNACTVPSSFTGGKELLPTGVKLTGFSLRHSVNNPKLWTINIGVAIGDDDLFQRNPPGGPIVGCIAATQGGQFCDVAQLTTSVYGRFK